MFLDLICNFERERIIALFLKTKKTKTTTIKDHFVEEALRRKFYPENYCKYKITLI